MCQSTRLPEGGCIDRSQPLNFVYNGKHYQGFRGDTVASALLANGIDIIGHSFKYRRPRGIMAAGVEEPNALIQVDANSARPQFSRKATQVLLYEGLVCNSTNGRPNVVAEPGGPLGNARGSRIPAGNGYRSFMAPNPLWPEPEQARHQATGFGCNPAEADPNSCDHLHHHVDVLVIGGGASGLSAARSAARSGARVMLVDEQESWGGHLLDSRTLLDASPPRAWIAAVIDELERSEAVTLLRRSTACGYYEHNFVAILERRDSHPEAPLPATRQRVHKVRTKQLILATGAVERPLVFANNDLPGCMLAGAVSAYINRYGVAPGHRLVLMASHDLAYQTALDWLEAGQELVAVVDPRPDADGELVRRVAARQVPVLKGHGVLEAQGRKRVKRVLVGRLSDDRQSIVGAPQRLSCDLVAVSGGYSPQVHLSCQAGNHPSWNQQVAGFVPGADPQDQHCIGAMAGDYDLADNLRAGLECGAIAARSAGYADNAEEPELPRCDSIAAGPAMAIFHLPHIKSTSRAPMQFVDFQSDETAADIERAAREGGEAIEHTKRHTLMGFGIDQSRLGNINGMAILAKARGQSIELAAASLLRAPYTPDGVVDPTGPRAETLFDPARFTAMHAWHLQQGAEFEDVGLWKRPWYFPRAGETMEQAVQRECLAVRNGVGILDNSSQDKIDIQGPDARAFLSRVHADAHLAPGSCHHGLMLNENGIVFDDSITSCINDHHLLMTTTGSTAGIQQWLESCHRREWPELQVYFTSVTEHWSTLTLSGPDSRKLLVELCDDTDLSADAFPFMTWKDARVAGVPARIFRISVTGELSFAIDVEANYGHYVWQQLFSAGKKYHLTPYGTEAMRVLRAEKGFAIAGQDTVGAASPFGPSLGRILDMNQPFDVIGNGAQGSYRGCTQLVGLRPEDSQMILPEGTRVMPAPTAPEPISKLGHVTASYYSASLGYSFALGLVKDGLSRLGETVYLSGTDGRMIAARISSPVFYDPEGERQYV
ncbi:2Fe-2S iron-sulfur cluster-binding protein [Zobellella maritima]|uniref:2Fe-2S iron-sulfur cluster-binding protein n=1 Tax=Zobellella maritima TaxID=2059725 RepID=UPI000E301ED4|nr:2Fe-2S iron-sulfur cluster-binding protein [Zobellella maritima]